ncbi:amidohydrolase [Dehalococcoidia bacterium]|nr:amidohydrolase [Dehalococcoidia bacterium]
MMGQIGKDYPVFDCDSHLQEQLGIWDYLSEKEKQEVKPWFWPEDPYLILNGNQVTFDAFGHGRLGMTFGFPGVSPGRGGRTPSASELSGPGVTKKLIRKIRSMQLTEEQCDYVDHKGAREPMARVADMDLQGIDQVMVIPLMMFSSYLFIENHYAAALVARAYNDWVWDWCQDAPDRLFPCGALPIQNPKMAADELHRIANKGFKVAAIRAADVLDSYPNQPAYEVVWDTFDDTGIVTGMHSLSTRDIPNPTGKQWSPGQFQDRAINPRQIGGASQTLGFMHEAQTWITNVLLSGFLERHPGTTLAIMESNASWLPMLLDQCDKAFHLYKSERTAKVNRLPSDIFPDRCFIAFEGDEKPVYRQHPFFEDIGIWSSDVYHHDGADAWTAIRAMRDAGVPLETEAKLMGANASRMYGIKPKIFTTLEPESYPRPDWYPKLEDIEAEYADRTTVR